MTTISKLKYPILSIRSPWQPLAMVFVIQYVTDTDGVTSRTQGCCLIFQNQNACSVHSVVASEPGLVIHFGPQSRSLRSSSISLSWLGMIYLFKRTSLFRDQPVFKITKHFLALIYLTNEHVFIFLLPIL